MQEVNDRISVEVDREFIKKESQIYVGIQIPKILRSTKKV